MSNDDNAKQLSCPAGGEDETNITTSNDTNKTANYNVANEAAKPLMILSMPQPQ